MYSRHGTHTSNKQINQCTFRDWKDGLMVKRTLCSCKFGFGFQHPHDTFYFLFKGSNALFWLPLVLHIHDVRTYNQAHTRELFKF